MENRKRPRSFNWFVDKLAHRLTRFQKTKKGHYSRSTSTEHNVANDYESQNHNMAEEEDFSSLPVSDRFTHKVDLLPFWFLFGRLLMRVAP